MNSVVNEHLVITNRFLGQNGHFRIQINPVITNKNGRFRAVRYNRVFFSLVFRHFYSIHPSSLEKLEIVKLSPRLDRNNNHVTNNDLSYTHKKSIFPTVIGIVKVLIFNFKKWNFPSISFDQTFQTLLI